jgi:hypothetical protein
MPRWDHKKFQWKETRAAFIAAFLRYTFQPLPGFAWSVGALTVMAIMTYTQYNHYAVNIFNSYAATFLMFMIASYLKFIKYHKSN